MGRPSKYPEELRERAVRMVAEVGPQYGSQWAAITAVAGMPVAAADSSAAFHLDLQGPWCRAVPQQGVEVARAAVPAPESRELTAPVHEVGRAQEVQSSVADVNGGRPAQDARLQRVLVLLREEWVRSRRAEPGIPKGQYRLGAGSDRLVRLDEILVLI